MAARGTLLATVAILCFAQVLGAGVVKRSSDSESISNRLQEAATKAQQAISNVLTDVSQTLGINNLPSTEQVAQDVHNQSLSFARKVGQLVGELQNEFHSHQGELSGLLQSVANKWNETATSLQAQNAQVSQSAQELRTSFSNGLSTFFQEAEKLVEAIGPNARAASDNLKQITQTALDRVRETAQEFRNSLHDTTQNQSH